MAGGSLLWGQVRMARDLDVASANTLGAAWAVGCMNYGLTETVLLDRVTWWTVKR